VSDGSDRLLGIQTRRGIAITGTRVQRVLTIDQDTESAVCVVRYAGDLDFSTVAEVREAVDDIVSRGCADLVIDFSSVTYADSSALGLLVWVDKRLQPLGGRMVLAGADRNVNRVLELSGLLGVAPSVSAAASVGDALERLEPAAEGREPSWTQSFDAQALVEGMSDTRTRVVDMIRPLGMPEASLFDLKVAVGEALANAIRHGSPRGAQDTITIKVSAYDDRVEVRVSDHGGGFSGSHVCSADAYAPGGRGVMFMRALMDRVEFSGCDGGGTTVRLIKRLPTGSPTHSN